MNEPSASQEISAPGSLENPLAVAPPPQGLQTASVVKPRRKISRQRKPSAKRLIYKLLPEQRQMLTDWLFKENMSFREASTRTKKEFGRRIHRNSLAQFYTDEQCERNQQQILNSVAQAKNILKLVGKNSEKTYQALLAVMGQLVFHAALNAKEGKPPDLKLVFNGFPLLLDAREDAREEKKCALEREQWEFDVVRACHDHFNELQTIIGNQTVDEPSRLQAIRRRLFGKNLGEEEKQ